MRNITGQPRWPALFATVSASVTVAGSLALQPLSVFAQAVSVANGKHIFESRCVACHSLDTHRVGPALGTVFGRTAGKVPGFDFSPALSKATHTWGSPPLLAWLENPEGLVPGQAMNYRVENLADRQDVVAYLVSLSKK